MQSLHPELRHFTYAPVELAKMKLSKHAFLQLLAEKGCQMHLAIGPKSNYSRCVKDSPVQDISHYRDTPEFKRLLKQIKFHPENEIEQFVVMQKHDFQILYAYFKLVLQEKNNTIAIVLPYRTLYLPGDNLTSFALQIAHKLILQYPTSFVIVENINTTRVQEF